MISSFENLFDEARAYALIPAEQYASHYVVVYTVAILATVGDIARQEFLGVLNHAITCAVHQAGTLVNLEIGHETVHSILRKLHLCENSLDKCLNEI